MTLSNCRRRGVGKAAAREDAGGAAPLPRARESDDMDTLKADRPGSGGALSGTESRALIGQCKELVRSRLNAIVAEALDKLEDDLFKAAETTYSRQEQQVLFDAMTQTRTYRAELAAEFDRRFLEIFDRRITSRQQPDLTASLELRLEELSLVDDNAVEEQLIISQLARKTRNTIDPDQLLGIRARFGHLLSTDLLEDDLNPISPEAVLEALKLACDRVPGDSAVKTALLSAFQPYIARGMGTVYADVNQNLIAHHVLPRIKHTVQRARDTGAGGVAGLGMSQQLNVSQLMNTMGPQGLHPAAAALYNALGGIPAGMGGGMGGSGGMGGPGAMAQSGAFELSQLLANVLSGPPQGRTQVARMLADPSRYSFESMLATPASPALLDSLSRLQGTSDLHGGEGQPAIDFLQHLDREVRAQSHPLDQLTIELVTMVFDYIIGDKSIPATVKAELSRLQIVAVKAAILDRTFFARRQHPMRQLLDRIAEASHDPDINTAASSPFVSGLRGLVDDIVASFTDDLAVFSSAMERLEKLIADDEQARQREIQPTAQSLEQKEKADISHASALAEVRRRVNKRTPVFVRDFLSTWWTRTLVDAYLHDREGDDSWTHRLGVVDALVWSVSSLKKSEIQSLAGMLPKLVRSLLRGMTAVGMPNDARHAFFNQLMETHTAMINESKAKSAEAAAESSVTPADLGPASEAPPEPEEQPLTVVGGNYHLHTVMALERGVVMEFAEGESTLRAKLTWVSPKQTLFLFTSVEHGARKFARDALADALAEGHAKVVEASAALMDRVLQAVVGPASVA
jgi:hypothetical protein